MVATVSGKQRCGRCGIHGSGEISGTVVGGGPDPQVAAALDTSPRTVFRTKRRYAEEGLDGVLHDHPQANRYRKLDDRGEASLIALACSLSNVD